MKKILLILGIAILIGSTNDLYAWTEPTLAPPNGNVLAPLRLDSNGHLILSSANRIGIGVTNPSFSVDAAGSLRSAAAVYTPILRPVSTDLTVTGSGWGMIFSIDTDANSANTYRWLGDNVEIMRLTDTGNLGVGLTNPAHKLDVNGDVNVTGCLRVDGTCISAGGGTVSGTGATSRIPLWLDSATLGNSMFEQGNSSLSKINSWKLTDAWGPDIFVVKENDWDGSSNNNYGGIVGGHFYSYGGINSGGPTGSEGGAGELYVQGRSMLMGNVGVGISNPSNTLDVGGTFRVNGSSNGLQIATISNNGIGGSGLRVSSEVIALNAITSGTNSYAISGQAGAGANARGVSGAANDGYGVYGISTFGYGIYCNSQGTALCGGNRTWTNTSDIRLKENVKTITNGLDKVLNLRGVQYEWKGDETNDKSVGFIAQEVMEVVPEVVSQDSDGYYTISESSMTAVLVEAIKELKAENDDLRERIEKLEAKIK